MAINKDWLMKRARLIPVGVIGIAGVLAGADYLMRSKSTTVSAGAKPKDGAASAVVEKPAEQVIGEWVPPAPKAAEADAKLSGKSAGGDPLPAEKLKNEKATAALSEANIAVAEVPVEKKPSRSVFNSATTSAMRYAVMDSPRADGVMPLPVISLVASDGSADAPGAAGGVPGSLGGVVAAAKDKFNNMTQAISGGGQGQSVPAGLVKPGRQSESLDLGGMLMGGGGANDALLHAIAASARTRDMSEQVGAGTVAFAPYGRMVPCRLVTTLESFSTQTPVVALVSEDVWWNDQLIVPAGTEVHGSASSEVLHGSGTPGVKSAKMASGTAWRFIFPSDEDRPSGAELRIRGVALTKKSDASRVRFGLEDGTYGFTGRLIETQDFGEIKMFAATALASFASALQDRQNIGSQGATSIENTPRNALLSSGAAVLTEYAKNIQASIKAKGAFVLVPAGTEFYVYVQQSIMPATADMPAAPGIPANYEFQEDAAAARKRLLQSAGAIPADGAPAIPNYESVLSGAAGK